MAHDFFLSYARRDNDVFLRKFFEELSEEVRGRRGAVKDAALGFFDQRDIELGDDWDAAIVEALQSSATIVPVLSPGYFKSGYCGRELALFLRRVRAAAPAGALPPVIKSIVWIPFSDEDVPPALAAAQLKFGDPDAVHNKEGFRYVIKQRQAHRTELADAIKALAKQIVSASDAPPIPRLADVPRLRDIVLTPPQVGAQAPAARPVPVGGKHVHFVYVAASPDKFGNDRTNRVPYLDAGGPDWKPFFPASQTRVHVLLQRLASKEDLDFTSGELPFSENLIAEIERAWEQRNIVVLVVDPWSVHWDAQYRSVLERLDQRLDYNWCVLVPRNEQDPDFTSKREEILATVSRTFDRHANLSPNPIFYRDGIRSAGELETAVREVLTRLKDEIRKRAPVSMPVPAGPSKSVLSGPSGRA